MSGGYFGFTLEYAFDEIVDEIVDDILKVVANNDSTETDKYGDPISRGFSPEIIPMLKESVVILKKTARMFSLIDCLLCDDIGEKEFLERWQKEIIEKEQG